MKKIILVLAAVLIALPSYSGASVFQPLSPAMEAKIQAIRDRVRAHGGTFEVGYSAAMDKKISDLCGLKVPEGWKKDDAAQVRMLDSTVQSLPSSFDWRSKNGVTPIKNQGSCGDCWAFATVGPLESQILLKDGLTVDLSEQYLVSCNSTDGAATAAGGLMTTTWTKRPGQQRSGRRARIRRPLHRHRFRLQRALHPSVQDFELGLRRQRLRPFRAWKRSSRPFIPTARYPLAFMSEMLFRPIPVEFSTPRNPGTVESRGCARRMG